LDRCDAWEKNTFRTAHQYIYRTVLLDPYITYEQLFCTHTYQETIFLYPHISKEGVGAVSVASTGKRGRREMLTREREREREIEGGGGKKV